MKKLMIAATVALAFAGISQASAYYWGVSSGADARPYYTTGDKVYVMLASDWSDNITLDAVKSASFVMDGAEVSGSAYTSVGTTKAKIASNFFESGDGKDVSGDTLDVLFVQVNNDNKYFTWTEALTSTASTAAEKNEMIYTGTQIAGKLTAFGGEYKSFGVPEPTSGLLLLLGMGALALRRKRA